MESPNRQIVLKRSDMRLDRSCFAPWRRDLPEKFLLQIARQQPFLIDPLKDYLTCGNDVIVRQVAEHISAHGPLQHPNPSKNGYVIGIKECTDSRAVTTDLAFLLEYETVHQRTAGSSIRKAKIFKTLAPGGLAVVTSHLACGATDIAHKLVGHEKPDIDPYVLSLITSIPYHVRAEPNPAIRDPENAIAHAFSATRLLKLAGREDIIVCPSYLDWTQPEPFNWLECAPQSPCAARLKETAKRMTEYAMAEGRDFNTQYAMLTLLCDACRFGRIDGPREVFGELGDAIFCVNADFRSFDPSLRPRQKHISNTAMGSVMYAAYDHFHGNYGHVAGVGGRQGTHILGIMDVCATTLHNVKKHLLDNYPLIRDLTEYGKRILLIHYDRGTAKITFLND